LQQWQKVNRGLGRSAQENQPIKSNPSGAFKKISEEKKEKSSKKLIAFISQKNTVE
jgi:hypothetical protein